MVIYAKGSIGDAWQYNGETESMPDWVKESSDHHIEIDKSGVVNYWSGNERMRVDKGDWFVMFCDGTTHLWDDYAFKSSFTFSNPARCETGSVFFKKYRVGSIIVHAWQYTGDINFSKLPNWVADLIVHQKLGYFEDAPKEVLQFRYEGVLFPILKGDWLVRNNKDSFQIVPGDDFKEFFEEID